MAKPTKLPSGNWRVRIFDYTDANGKKHYKSFTAATKKEAAYMAAEYSISRKGNTYEDMTLAEAYDRYIDSKSAVLSPSTVREYRRARKGDFPKMMGMKISKITPELVQTAVNEASAQYSPKSVRNKHGLLHSVLKAYYPSLVLNTRLPQKIKPEYTIPTTAEIQKMLSVADDKIRAPLLLASSGGLRRSEICALTPQDITDFGINVNKAKVYGDNRQLKIKPPKTKAGYRFVPLPKQIIKEVRNWQYFDCAPDELANWFKRVIKTADVPHTTFHKLRHYFASECHAKGIPDQYIALIGGWESVTMLHNIYQHTLRDKVQGFNDKVVTIFNNNFAKDDTKDDIELKEVSK